MKPSLFEWKFGRHCHRTCIQKFDSNKGRGDLQREKKEKNQSQDINFTLNKSKNK